MLVCLRCSEMRGRVGAYCQQAEGDCAHEFAEGDGGRHCDDVCCVMRDPVIWSNCVAMVVVG